MTALVIIVCIIGIGYLIVAQTKKGVGLNRIVSALTKLHFMSKDLNLRLRASDNLTLQDLNDQFKEEVFVMAYIFQKEVAAPLQKSNWSMHTPLIFPGVSGSRIELWRMYQDTMVSILDFAKQIDEEEVTSSIIGGKEAYWEFDKALPDSLKRLLRDL